MANFKYFSGDTELISIRPMDNKKFAALFPGVVGRKYDGYYKFVGFAAGKTMDGQELPVDRLIEYKSNPSRHVCDARCVNAAGKIMKCECSCGGQNHGKSAFATTNNFHI